MPLPVIAVVGLSFLKKHWLPIAIVVGTFFLVSGAYIKGYYKGKNQCEARIAKAVAEEIQTREEAADTLRQEIRNIQDRIRIRRQKTPVDDKRDSCILSNDPFAVNCLDKEDK